MDMEDIINASKEAQKQLEIMKKDINCYELTVDTSNTDDAGTDSNIWFTVYYRNTELPDSSPIAGDTHRLSGETEKNQSSKTIFVEDGLQKFREIHSIEFVHDNSGNKPGWCIAVIHLNSINPDRGRVAISYTGEKKTWIAYDEEGSYCSVPGDRVKSGKGVKKSEVTSVYRTIVLKDKNDTYADYYHCSPP